MKIEVKVYRTYDSDSKMKAMCNVRIDDTFCINGVKLIQGNNGYFIGMPQYTDKNGKYHDHCFIVSKDAKEKVREAVINSYNEFLNSSVEDEDLPFE